jgi:hypothetical protein
VPVFNRFQVQTTVELAVRKTSAVSLVQAKIIVVAFNVGGTGGIAERWRLNGLSGSSTVACGPTAACTFPAPCSTIWVQMPDCATFDLARVRVVGDASEFTATTAIVVLEVTVRALPEGEYAFQLHLPVTDTVSWTYQSMAGRLAIVALADARRSNLTLCQGAGCNSTTAADVFQSTNGALGSVVARIAAADVHGFSILRSGEALSVAASGPSGNVQTSPAVFDGTSQQYVATLATLTVAGEYVVDLISSLTNTRATKARFSLVCAQGYVTSGGGECALQRIVCDTLIAAPATAGFVIRDSLVLSNLGSANSVDLVPLSTTESFRVENGQATVRFVSPGTFLIRVTEVGGRQCTLAQQRQVSCPAGYVAANGGCQPIVSGDVCAGFAVKDQAGTPVGAGRTGFTVGDRLQVVVDASKASLSMYQFELVPKQGKVTGNATDPVSLDQPGSFSLDLAYTPPDGPSVRCPALLPTVDVVASRSCDKLQATFLLGNSSARGATSSLRASVSLPAGLNPTVVASPQDSSVPVHLSPSAAKSSSWEGLATLPSTGPWAIAVYAGQEPCVLQSQVLNVSCMRGFEDDGQGCRCPQGLENVNGECKPVQQREPCEQAVVRSSQSTALVQRGTAAFGAGTVISVALGAGVTANGFRTLLVPTQGTEARNLSQPIQLNRTGQFSLQLEYLSAAGPKLCALISAISVRCSVGEEEVDGKCRSVVKSPCEQATLNYSLGPDAALGARSRMEAALKLPDGMDASIIATPLDNAVRLPLARANSERSWTGSASLPFTGAWSVQVGIGKEQCVSLSRIVTINCSETFLDDGRGRCVCPDGKNNVNGECRNTDESDACQYATVSSSEDGSIARTNLSATVMQRPGARLSVQIWAAANAKQIQTVLIPSQGTEVRNVTDDVALTRVGSFGLHLRYLTSRGESKQCPLASKVVVACREGEDEVNGICQPCDPVASWFDPLARKCIRRPRMALKAASDRLAVTLVKTRKTKDIEASIEVRLASGDVNSASPVSWTATSSAAWLSLVENSGIVNSANPVAELRVNMNAAGHADASSRKFGQPLSAVLTVESRFRARSDMFQNSTDRIEMLVELRVESAVYVLQEHVEIRKEDGSLLPFDAIGTLRRVDALSVTVHAFDCETEALPINRGGELLVLRIRHEASGGWVNTTLQYSGSDNVYSAESAIQALPTSSSEVETYLLILQSHTRDGAVTGEVSLTFEVKNTNKTLIIAGSIGAVSCGPLGLHHATCDRHAALRCAGRAMCCVGEPLQGLNGQVVVLTLILMGVLLYKHRDRAGEFLRSFVSFEGSPRSQPALPGASISLDFAVACRSPRSRAVLRALGTGRHLRPACCPAPPVRSLGGCGLVCFAVGHRGRSVFPP